MQNLPRHLANAGQRLYLRQLLLDFNWIQAKLNTTGVNALIADYDFLSSIRDMSRIQGALRLSANILNVEKTQIAGQLIGRLLQQKSERVQSLLEQARILQRGPWLHPLNLCLTPPGGPMIATLEGHKGRISTVAMTPDAKLAISGSDDGILKVWDLKTRREIYSIAGHKYSVKGVDIIPDGQFAISWAEYEDIVKIWDLETGRLVKYYEWNENGEIIIDVVPDHLLAVTKSDADTLKISDHTTDKTISVIRGYQWYYDWTGKAMTPDGQLIVSGSKYGKLKFLTLAGKDHSIRAHRSCVSAVAVTPDGRLAISGSTDNKLKVWDARNYKEIASLEGHASTVTAVAITPNGYNIVSGSKDRMLKFWDLKKCQKTQHLQIHEHNVSSVAVTPDGKFGLSASWDRTIKIWELETCKEICCLVDDAGLVNAIAVTPDSRFVVSVSNISHFGPNPPKVWDLQTGKEAIVLEGGEIGDEVLSVTVTPDSTYLLTGHTSGYIQVWNLLTGNLVRTLHGHSSWVDAVAVTPDGRFAVSGSSDKTLKVWNLRSHKATSSLHGHTGYISAVVIASSGSLVISGSQDNTLIVWDLRTSRKIRTITGHTGGIHTVAATSDGSYAVSGSADYTLRVWDLHNGDEVAGFRGESGILSCAIAPDGRSIITGDGLGRVYFLRMENL